MMTAGLVPSFDELASAADALSERLLARRWMMASAESCTGGLIGAVCTSLAGSSRWYERGFITYSNEAKTDSLGVSPDIIAARGAVSREVAQAMASGALAHSAAHVAVAVTGIAGPTGGSPDKPVGTVWLAVAVKASAKDSAPQVTAQVQLFPGDRSSVRALTVACALAMLSDAVG
jgi:nicotinamide-nucleotide amidase